MNRPLWPTVSLFRPQDEELSPENRLTIQTHRLLSLLGAVLVASVGTLYAVTNPQATDPAWARLSVAALFVGLLGASYGSSTVRRSYPAWMRGVLYVLMGWFCVIAALNGYAGNYDMGLLLVYGILPVVVALGAETEGPVWWFLGTGFLAGTTGAVLGPASVTQTLVLTGSLATVALVEGIALRGQLAGQARLERQNDLFARAQDLASIGAWEYEVASDELFWTDQVYAIHDLPSSYKPTTEEAIAFYHADDQPVIRKAFGQAIEKGEPYDKELRLSGTEGEQQWVRARGTPQTKDGEVVRVRGTFQDITERKTQQQRLEMLQERLELAVDGAGLGTWDWDLGTDEVMFNRQWAEMLGYSREELDFHFEIWEKLVHPDDLPKATAALEDHFSGETDLYEQEIRMRTKNGDWKWIQTIGRVADRDEEGAPIRAAGIHLDIDDRKRDKQELRARGLAMETSIDGMAILGPNDEYQFVNQAHADIYGYDDPDAFLGETWEMCYGDGERPRFEEKIFPVLRETGSWRGEALGKRRDGTTFPQEVSLTLTEEGHVVGVVRDISERKARERRLRELAGEYETTLNNVTDAIFLVDVGGTGRNAEFRFERLSASYEAKTGLTTGEVQGQTPHEVLGEGPGAELTANFHRCVENEAPVTYEEEVATSGETRIWQTSLAPVLVGGAVERIVGIGRDITERVERERELERKNARLDSFAGLVSHDLRNPLNVATGRLRLAKEEDDPSHLDAIGRALGRMDAIIEDVLTLTWSGRSIDPEELAPQDLAPLAETSWDQVDTAEAALQLDNPPLLRCDEDRLRRLLENLFRNAVEHGGDTVSVRVGGLPGGFYVEDDGPGLPEGSPEAVFEAGYSSNKEGTGLGLSIVKSIAETHGWTLTATESPGGGTRFEVTGVDVEATGEATP